ncbi:hypothetical protein [Aurantiacibacter hainanensis]|uniref:hypothetical protein n=1 Tax=Aurantiacibacter hainanensis TaxID=3076114 RepID=UPI0030C76606
MKPRQFSDPEEAIQFLANAAAAQSFVIEVLIHALDTTGVLDKDAVSEALRQPHFADPAAQELLDELADAIADDEPPRFSVIDGGKDNE